MHKFYLCIVSTLHLLNGTISVKQKCRFSHKSLTNSRITISTAPNVLKTHINFNLYFNLSPSSRLTFYGQALVLCGLFVIT